MHAGYAKSYEAEVRQYIEEQPWLRTGLKGMTMMAMLQWRERSMRGNNRALVLEATWGRLQ